MEIFWFIIIAVFWTGFFVLEGFDFGVGALHRQVGTTDDERRVAVSTVGPFWDGNEVWLVVAGAGMFAAFPSWYATMFSALYLPLVLILVALIVRGVSFEYQRKLPGDRWRRTWSWALTISSILIPLLIGVGLGDLLSGLPIDENEEFTGSFVDTLTPYGLWVGITLLVLSLLQGANFLVLKAPGRVQVRARQRARLISVVSVLTVTVFVIWTRALADQGILLGPLEVIAVLAVVGAAWAVHRGMDGWAFSLSSVAMATSVLSIFVELYPNVMVSSTDAANNLTVAGTASSPYALKIMTIVAVVIFPLVLAYTIWSYVVFRGRVAGPPTVRAQP